VLRGKGLEIFEDQRRVQASLEFPPAGAVSGQAYPETVTLRLIDPKGGATVKPGARKRAAASG
jgi:hypothetical protein